MGSVYLVLDTHQGDRAVALKILRPEVVDPGSVDLFRQEFRAMTRLRHPNLAEVYDFCTSDQDRRHYLTLEYVDGKHLVALPRGEIAAGFDDLAVQTLRALDYIHARGILHNDIKPQNILVREALQLKLLDFGLAQVGAGAAGRGVSGTVHYIAPERFSTGRADARSDLYSLGVVLYEALTGRLPFEGQDASQVLQAILQGQAPPPRSLAPDVPERVEAFVLALLARDPAGRPSSASAALTILNRGRAEPLLLDTPETRASFVTSGRFIGRDDELASLVRSATDHLARPGDDGAAPRLILLRGPSGIGKTRLLRELRYRLQLAGIRNLTGRYYQDAGSPLEAVVEILRQLPGHDDLPEPQRGVLRRLLPSHPAEGSTEESKQEFIAGVIEILDRLAGADPGVLILEDLHWSDAPGVDLLEQILLRPHRGPWLVVGSLRDEDAEAAPIGGFLKRAGSMTRARLLPLRPLNKEQVADLIASMVPFEERPEGLAGLLADRTDGNPLYLEEIMKTLADAGTLRRRGDAWIAESPGLDVIRLPDSLASAVAHRLARLPADERALADLLAVFNRPVPAPVLAAAAGVEAGRILTLVEALDRLRIARLEPQRTGPALAGLAHSRIRDALYDAISGERRRDLHRAAGLALEAAHRDLPDEAVEELAHHFAAAQVRERAADYAMRAARRAFALYNLPRVNHFVERALEFLREDDTPRRIEMLRLISLSYASDTLEPAKGLHYARLLHDEARRAGDVESEVHGLRRMSWSHTFLGEAEAAIEAARRGIALGRRAGCLRDVAWCLSGLGILHARAGRHEQAHEYFNEACEASTTAASPPEHVTILTNRALNHLGLGQPEIASRLMEEVLANAPETIADHRHASHLVNLGVVRVEVGDLIGGLRSIEPVVSWAREHGDYALLTEMLNNLLIIYWFRGRPDLALRAGEEEGALRNHFGDVAGFLPSSDWVGRVEAGLGRLEQAIARHQEGLETARRLEDRRQEGFLLAALGGDYLGRRAWDRAAALGRDAAAIGREVNHRRVIALGLMVQARAESERGDRKATAAVLRALTRIEARYMRYTERLDVLKTQGHCALLGKRFDDALREARAGIAACETGGFREPLWRFHALMGDAWHAKKVDDAANGSYNAALKVIRDTAADIEDTDVRNEYLNETRLRELQPRDAGATRGPAAPASLSVTGAAATSAAPTIAGKGDPVRMLTTVYEITQIINSILDLRELLTKVMDLAVEIVGAERGLVFLYRSETDEMEMVVARNMEHQTIKDAHEYSRSILKEVGRGRSILSVDAITDDRFRRYQSVSEFQIRSLMCVPLKIRNAIIGTVYVDTRRAGVIFTEDDLRFLEAFANQAAIAIENARLYEQVRQENRYLREAVQERYGFENIVGRSARMRDLFALVNRISTSSLPVLIRGESGTGKELVARAVHHNSPRRDRRFFTENCAALTDTLLESELFGHVRGAFTGADATRKGLFELADGGTVFLDEVGDMSLAMQSKLLRVLQDGEIRPVGSEVSRRVDVRIVSATNRDLEAMVREKRFREDLYFRLNVVNVKLPSLRDRRDDIPLLIDHFLAKVARENNTPKLRVDPTLMSLLTRYDWPGNVRELENQVYKLALFASGDTITRDAAAHDGEFFPKISVSGRGVESNLTADDLRAALRDTGGNRDRAAELLGISRATLFRKLKQFQITDKPARPQRRPPEA